MKVLTVLVAAALALPAATAQAESCSGLQSRINTLMAQANNAQGICQAARIEVALYQAAGDYNWYCVNGGKAQAQEYYNARDQAQQTANASCS